MYRLTIHPAPLIFELCASLLTMDSNPIILQSATIAQAVKAVMDAWVIPGINKMARSAKLRSQILLIPREEHFEDYLVKTYGKLSYLNTLAFKNNQLLLTEVYQPLTIINREVNEKCKITTFPEKLIEKYHNLLITDTAGMGKSTLLKYLFLKALEQQVGIPIFVELRKLTKKHHLIDEISSQLGGIKGDFDKALMIELFQHGNFYFLFDGFDEIPLSNLDSVIEDLKEFISSLPKNNFILTSRPETLLSTFGHFRQFEIISLKESEAYSLLKKYDLNGSTSASLIKELKLSKNASIKEFLSNPLLVSLLYIVFNYKATIPLKKHLFYSQVYDALFESHDLTKGAQMVHEKKSGLDIADFEKIVRYIGFQSYKAGKITFSRDEMMTMIGNSQKLWKSLNFTESSFLSDLTLAVPLFTKEGTDYKWTHKSLSEYFAAKFIYLDITGKRSDVLSKIYLSPNLEKYINLLDIYYDIDISGFRESLILPLLKEYRDYLKIFDEDSPDYFLRNLLFLKKFRYYITITRDPFNKFEEIISTSKSNVKHTGVVISHPTTVLLVTANSSTSNEAGKRMLIGIMHTKRHPSVIDYRPGKYDVEWVVGQPKDRWIEMCDLIESSGMDPDKLGELCRLAIDDSYASSNYMKLSDIESEINAIESEIASKEFDFDF